MIGEADAIANSSCLKPDICIVGAGPAGIAMALDLSARGLSVVLLESGQLQADASTQSLYAGTVADEALHSPPERYRQRTLGGSSSIWGGRCMPMDPIDFEERSYVADSGWPISYADLLPFYPAANALAEAGRFSYDSADALGSDVPPLIRGFESKLVSTTGIERFSCPTRFASRYYKRLQLASGLQVLVKANCVGLKLHADGASIESVEVATLAGNRFSVAARATVLAMGGLETARLLLASNDVRPAGIGNENDVVGRYYMCHIAGNVGTLTLHGRADVVRHGYETSPEGIYCRRRISVVPDVQRQLNLINTVARLHFPRITDPSHRSGVLSGLFLSRKLISYEYGKRLNDGEAPTLANYLRHVRNVVGGPVDTAAFLTHWVTHRTLADRKFPSVILRNRSNRFSLEVHAEQTPLASSRITLGRQRDALGMPQLHVDWRYARSDVESIGRTLKLFAQEFRRSGVGEFEFDSETLEHELTRYGAYGGHHIGTARMGENVKTSVVDSDCQVHSVRNLFVAGSAVFPTSSQANPTLTLIALSLRLAGTLAKRLHAVQRVSDDRTDI
jgi:choline dehydrogenase-like flavoprotein